MRLKQIDILNLLILVFIITITSYFLFNAIFIAKYSDLKAHIQYIKMFYNQGRWPLYTIYYYMIYILSFKSTSYEVLKNTAIVTLITLVNIKIILSYFILHVDNRNSYRILIASIILTFVTPIVNWWQPTHVYLGQISPTIWHNSTNILAVPFAIILFYTSFSKLGQNKTRDYFLTGILLLLSVATKPNYALTFIPIYFFSYLYVFYKKQVSLNKHIINIGAVFLPTILFMLIQYSATFGQTAVIRVANGVEFSPLKVWSLYSPHLFISLILSIAFPIMMLVFYFKEIKTNKWVVLSWIIFLLATLEFTLLSEKGPSYPNANFMWGATISCFILFLTNMNIFIQQKMNMRFILTGFILMLHFMSGLYYYYLLTFRGFWL